MRHSVLHTTFSTALAITATLAALTACGEDSEETNNTATDSNDVQGAVTADGLVLSGQAGTALEGATLTIPAGALPEGVTVTLTTVDASTLPPLPDGGLSVGPLIDVKTDSEQAPSAAFTLEVPYDAALVAEQGQDSIQVKVWHRPPTGWALLEPAGLNDGGATVSVEADAFTTFGAGIEVP